MKRIILFSLMALMTVATFGRKHVENATVVADTIFYAENMSNVASADQASYYITMLIGCGQYYLTLSRIFDGIGK